MTSINWAFLCDYAYVANGKGSLIGIFDQIGIKTLPAGHPQMFLVVSLTIKPEDGSVKIGGQISTPSGNAIAFIEQPPVSVYGGMSNHNAIFAFYGIPLPEAGEYHIEVFINGASVHLVPLQVNLIR